MTAVPPRLSVVTGLETVFVKRCSNGPLVHQVHLRSVVVGLKVGPVGDSRPRSFDVRRSTFNPHYFTRLEWTEQYVRRWH